MIIYEGPSMLDRDVPIVAIVTGVTKPSGNTKTGALAQLWILRADMHPATAVNTGQDGAVCGKCLFAAGQGCYVSMRAPIAVYNAYRNGSYPTVTPEQVAGMINAVPYIDGLRLGAYGDPTAVPIGVIKRMMGALKKPWSGYTHQWKEAWTPAGDACDPEWRRFLMASAHTEADRLLARSRGYRAFVATSTARLPEVTARVCPASEEAGKMLTCSKCKQCDGAEKGEMRPDRVILTHGQLTKRATKAIGGYGYGRPVVNFGLFAGR